MHINVPEPSPKQVAREALPILKQLRQRDQEWADERERERRLPVSERSYDWQNYCRHGTNIGDPYGADLMCGRCEASVSIYLEATAQARVNVQRRLTATACVWELDKLGVLDIGADELADAVSIRITQRLTVQSV